MRHIYETLSNAHLCLVNPLQLPELQLELVCVLGLRPKAVSAEKRSNAKTFE